MSHFNHLYKVKTKMTETQTKISFVASGSYSWEQTQYSLWPGIHTRVFSCVLVCVVAWVIVRTSTDTFARGGCIYWALNCIVYTHMHTLEEAVLIMSSLPLRLLNYWSQTKTFNGIQMSFLLEVSVCASLSMSVFKCLHGFVSKFPLCLFILSQSHENTFKITL